MHSGEIQVSGLFVHFFKFACLIGKYVVFSLSILLYMERLGNSE